MNFQTELQAVRDIIQKAKDVLIVTHERPTYDSIGSSLALYLGLVGMGKKVTIACPDPMTVEFSSFIGVNKIVQEIGKRTFIISLDYVEGSIEKVSYNIEGDKFNLVIEPREGYESFSEDKVHFKHGGASADVIFSIDTIHLGGLKGLYESEKDLFASKPIVNVDRHPNNANFGTVNIVHPQSSSTAEIVYEVLRDIGVAMNQDIATNLLNAVYGATNSFTNYNVTFHAFEVAAAAMKAGGKKFRTTSQKEHVSEELPQEEQAVTMSLEHGGMPPQPVVSQEKKKQSQDAPSDWLKPKIFKSSNLG
ncbi:MAG: DHH family phosphoesterase [Patescibacteria group bacterium]|nr:DHH family phosphoesterase [Patescibacteria group bacterium]